MNGNHSTVAFYGRTDEGGLIGQESLSKRCVLFLLRFRKASQPIRGLVRLQSRSKGFRVMISVLRSLKLFSPLAITLSDSNSVHNVSGSVMSAGPFSSFSPFA